MAFNVRIFGHRGTVQLTQVNPRQFTGDIQEALYQPYEWSQVIITAGASAVSSIAVAGDLATCVMIEVPDGLSIRYEMNTLGRFGGPVNAGSQSPRLSGQNILTWTPGTTVSIVEQSFFL